MKHAASIATFIKWPLFGALFAGAALAVGYYFGGEVVHELGQNAGEGFARGVIRVQQQLAAVSGERGSYR